MEELEKIKQIEGGILKLNYELFDLTLEFESGDQLICDYYGVLEMKFKNMEIKKTSKEISIQVPFANYLHSHTKNGSNFLNEYFKDKTFHFLISQTKSGKDIIIAPEVMNIGILYAHDFMQKDPICIATYNPIFISDSSLGYLGNSFNKVHYYIRKKNNDEICSDRKKTIQKLDSLLEIINDSMPKLIKSENLSPLAYDNFLCRTAIKSDSYKQMLKTFEKERKNMGDLSSFLEFPENYTNNPGFSYIMNAYLSTLEWLGDLETIEDDWKAIPIEN